MEVITVYASRVTTTTGTTEGWPSTLTRHFLLKYNGICKQGHYNNRYHGGVANYTHSSLPVEEIKLNTNYEAVAVRVETETMNFVTFASIYIPGRVEVQIN